VQVMATTTPIRIAVGSQNKAKLRAAEIACKKLFGEVEIRGFTVPSGIPAQPLSAQETIQGSINRARNALIEAQNVGFEANYSIGMEGGLEVVSDVKEDGIKWFECGWMTVVEAKSGKIGVGSTARVPCGPRVVKALVEEGQELCDVVDELSGKADVRSNEGFMGIVTNGTLPRDECYAQGILFAFAKFVSNEIFWS
jgi:inosine/xanthosine triphosphatase